MSRRTLLLLLLFLAMSLLYAHGIRENLPDYTAKQRAQTHALNTLDESVLNPLDQPSPDSE